MAQKKKRKKSRLNPLVKMKLKKELEKREDLSPEAREKIMMAFERLDMKTLITDPDALAEVMKDPAGELKYYLLDPEDANNSEDSSATDAPSPSEDGTFSIELCDDSADGCNADCVQEETPLG